MPAPQKDSRVKQIGRVAATAGIGGLAGRTLAWHPVHGGRLNRGTLIGAGIGAATQIGAEKLSKRFEGDDKRVVRKGGIVAGGIGLYAAAAQATTREQADRREDFMADLRMRRTGRVSEKEAIRQNTKVRRAMGAEGETFIPRMPRLARETAKKVGFRIVTEDQTGGTIEDKLSRLHESARGTPEGDAALAKLNALRKRQGKTVIERAKKAISKVAKRFTPKKVSKFAGHLLSARDELNSIVELGLPKNLVAKRSSAVAQGDLDLLRKSNQSRLKTGIGKKKKITATSDSQPGAYPMFNARQQLNAIIELKEIDLGRTYEDYPGNCESVTPRKKSFPSLYISDRTEDIDLPLEGRATVRYKLRSKTIRQDDAGKKKHSADIEIQSIDPIDEIKNQLIGGKAVKLMSARDRLDSIIQFERGTQEIGAGIKSALTVLARRRAGRAIPLKAITAPPSVGTLIGKKTGISAKGWYKERSYESYAAELRDIIQLSDPRPRNDLGMFTDSEEGAPNPNQIDSVYKQPIKSVSQNLAGGAVAGAGAAVGGGAIKALVNKLKKPRA